MPSFPNHQPPGAAVPAVAPGAGPLCWEVTIYGNPIAKKRPRFARRGKSTATYNAQETEEGRLYLELMQAWGQREPLSCPLAVQLLFGMPIPASTSAKKRFAMLKGDIRHAKKPDSDNLAKFILDVGNGLLWVDDSLIDTLTVRRVYATPPFTRIVVVAE